MIKFMGGYNSHTHLKATINSTKERSMVKLIFDDWSWRCENCNGMMALPGIIASLEMLKDRGWKFCPYCGKKIDFKTTEAEKH